MGDIMFISRQLTLSIQFLIEILLSCFKFTMRVEGCCTKETNAHLEYKSSFSHLTHIWLDSTISFHEPRGSNLGYFFSWLRGPGRHSLSFLTQRYGILKSKLYLSLEWSSANLFSAPKVPLARSIAAPRGRATKPSVPLTKPIPSPDRPP